MKLSVKLYRTTTIPTAELLSVAGLPLDSDGSPEGLMKELRLKFGPFTPRFEIFPPSDISFVKTIVGMEVMCFDLPEAQVPMTGMVLSDPIDSRDIDRVDGAIESELSRMGIGSDCDSYEWRQLYRLKGN